MINITGAQPWRIHSSVKPKYNFVMIATLVLSAIMFAGMFGASAYQAYYNIESTTLLDAPIVFQRMIVGGFLSFLAMLASFVGLVVWCDVKEYILKQPPLLRLCKLQHCEDSPSSRRSCFLFILNSTHSFRTNLN